MLGMIAALALTASVDGLMSLPAGPRAGEERLDGTSWSGSAAGMGALGLVGGDVAVLSAGVLLIGATANNGCEAGGPACANAGAVLLTLAGLAVVPPVFALLLAEKANGAGFDGRTGLLTVAAQVTAIGLFAGALSTSGGAGRTALFMSAAAVHFVGIPLAVGLARVRTAPGEASEGVAPTLSVVLRW